MREIKLAEMARSIKFRGWDNLYGKYSSELRCTVDTFFDSKDGNIQLGVVDIGKAFIEPPEGQVIEQYTGLKDKNGREIYEGDICIGDWGCKFEVCWDSDGSGFTPFTNAGLGGHEWDRERPQDCTIIGNIHENQELLK